MRIVQIEPIGINPDDLKKIETNFERAGHEWTHYDHKPQNEKELIERAKEAQVIILSNLPLSKNVISQCHDLKMISVAFAGVDHIAMDVCHEKGIVVSNAAGYSNHAVSELTIGSVVNLYRKILWNDHQTRNLSDRQGFLGSELHGKTFGIIGTGQIGLQVARLANAFGCKVLAFNRSRKNIPNVEFSNLDYLLKNSDIVSLHLPLTNKTKHLIAENKIKLMKKTAILINTARGPVVDYHALATALKNKNIAGAAIDVYEKEPPLDKDHPLFDAPNILLTPHIGYATKEAIQLRGKIVIDNISQWMAGKPQNVMY
ncbi:MAG TPA: NAD(P)-dependent oxidoreductase [Bacteroidales bacterium]|nr:NAD(P)-dependent oxidoreductase [Bacteroidales bacterium]